MRRRPAYGVSRCSDLEEQLADALRQSGVTGRILVTATKGPVRKIHVTVESTAFEGMPWAMREELVWSVLEQTFEPPDIRAISLLVLETPDEAPLDFDDTVRRHHEQRARMRELLAQRGFQVPEP